MFGIPTFDLLTDRGKQEFIQYIINLMRNEIISFTSSYNTPALQNVISSEHLIGTNALRPEAHSVPVGTYYTSTDVSGGTTYRSDGVVWVQIGGGVQGGVLGYYGSFYDTTTQSIPTINTATAMTFNNTAESNGVSRGSPTSRIVLANAGTYNIQFSAQLDQSSASTREIWIWLRENGTDVSESNGLVTLQGSSTENIASWNWIYTSTTTNEYFEIMWTSNDTGTKITAFPTPTNGPAIPSVILTVTQVMNTQVGPTGPAGPANTLSIGTVTTGAAGTNVTASITGTSPTQTLNLGIPGSPTVNVGTTNTTAAGTNATVTNSGTQYAQVLNFTVPGSPTVNAGTTTTNAAGTNATVTASGTPYARVFDFGIPGNPTVAVGTTTTSSPGGNASVVNSGTTNALVLDFTIPAGPTGPTGPAGVGNPSGAIIAFGGTTLPSDYLWCDGSLVSKTTYATLYSALGPNRYGTDTATDFYLPDLRSRFFRGTATTNGAVSTNNTNTHTHTLNATTVSSAFTGTAFNTTNQRTEDTGSAHTHGVNGASTSSVGGHNHNNNGTTTTGGANKNVAAGNTSAVPNSGHQHTAGGTSTSSTGDHNHNNNGANTGNASANHTHSFGHAPSGNIANTVTTGTAVSESHIPAYVEVNYIIKT